LPNPLPGELWTKIESLFLEAAELPASSRESYVRGQCRDAPRIRDEVLSLLSFCDHDPPELMAALGAGAATLVKDDISIGLTLGPYRIERELGRGGMAVVYLAFRTDGQFQKHVAIKLIKRGMDSATVVERLRRERSILAQLDHPNIGRLLDGGTTVDGLPYIIMEYVEGLPIDRFCAERELGIEQRCALMEKVFDAVSYAHRKLVVHRDLKPSNILVTADGTPKLLDFGLAKILDAEPDGGVTAADRGYPLTPNYASPEQLRGAELSTATDIYSLGVILHELLAGQVPHPHPPSGRAEWETSVCESEIARPSSLETEWKKQLQGDLDTILMKALRKEPDRRYASVDQFAADVRRYLEFRPILARTDSWWYRSRKFIRRRRYPVLAGVAALSSLIFGIVIALTQARHAETARRRAEDQLALMVNLSNRSLSDVQAMMERLPGATAARRELIRISLDFLEGLSKDASTNPALRIAMAKAYLRLGDLLGDPDSDNLGDEVGAMKSYRSATALLASIPAGMGGRERQLDWLDLQQKMAALMRTSPAAISLLNQALSETAKWPPAQMEDKAIARGRAGIYLRLTRAYQGDYSHALEYATQYLAAMEALVKKYPLDPELQYDLSAAETAKGWALKYLGDLESTADYYLATIRIREQLVKDHPGDLLYQRALMLAYEHYADLLGGALSTSLGRLDQARTYYKKAQPFAETRMGDPKNTAGAASFAGFLTRSSRVDVGGDQLIESFNNLKRAAEIFETISASAGGPINDRAMARAYVQLGRCLIALAKPSEAMAKLNGAAGLTDRLLVTNPKDPVALQLRMDLEEGLSRAFTLTGNRAAAVEHATEMMRAAQSIGSRDADEGVFVSRVAQAWLTLATVHRRFAEGDASRQAAQQAVQVARPLLNGREWDPNAHTLREAEKLLLPSM
jgi:serine/threonine protein kinase